MKVGGVSSVLGVREETDIEDEERDQLGDLELVGHMAGEVEDQQLHSDGTGDSFWRGERTVDEIIADLRQIQQQQINMFVMLAFYLALFRKEKAFDYQSQRLLFFKTFEIDLTKILQGVNGFLMPSG